MIHIHSLKLMLVGPEVGRKEEWWREWLWGMLSEERQLPSLSPSLVPAPRHRKLLAAAAARSLDPVRGWSSSHNQWSRLPTKMLLTGRGIPGRGVGCRLGDAGMSPWFRHTHECCVLNNARMRCRVFIKTCHHGAGHHQHNANTCLGLAGHNEAHTTLRSSTATRDIHYDPTLHNTMDSQHRKLV